MKKSTLLLAMFMASTAVNAQLNGKGTTLNSNDYTDFGFMPAVYSFDGKAKIVIPFVDDENHLIERVDIYDDDISKVKSINIPENKNIGYSFYRERQERVACWEYYSTMEWEVPSLSLTEAKDYIRNQLGYSVDSISVVNDSTYLFSFDKDYSFYHESYSYGHKYPRNFWALTTNGLYNVFKYYNTRYDGEWVERKVYNNYDYSHPIACMPMLDCATGQSSAENAVLVTQTLFNNDEAYEYVNPIYELRQNGETRKSDRDNNDEVDQYETDYRSVMTGFKIVSENGTTLGTASFGDYFIDYDKELKISLLTINGKQYIKATVNDDFYMNHGNIYEMFFRIDRNSSSIKQIGAPVKTKVYPTVADRNETITVEVGGNTSDREVFVHNAAGQTVFHQNVAAGQNTVQIDAAMLSRGLNVVSVKNGKNGNEACKVIVK